ncbi:MAG: alpha-glucosidase C-terminal domain-containing protein [Bacteroidales bacterium]|nr:alpha-glucosidase C-terminal domain-containing protein [Bacteroidales bacterium]
MNRFLIFSMFFLPLFSCRNINRHEPIMNELATPFLLQGDTSVFYLSDYVVDFRLADSVIFPGNCYAQKQNDSVFLIIKSGNVPPLSAISVFKGNYKEEIPVFNREKQKVVISYRGPEKFRFLKVIGSMNYWNRTNQGMTFNNGVWEQEFELAPGTYEYLFFSDSKEFADPENPLKIGNNSVLKVGKFLPEELPFIETRSFTKSTIELVTNQPLEIVMALWQNSPITAKTNGNSVQIEIPSVAKKSSGRSFIRLYAANTNGLSNDILIPLENGQVVSNSTEILRTDKHSMMMYFLMVDRFFNGDTANDKPVPDPEILPIANYFGGDLAGVNQKISEGYFANLGINTLWLSPISQNPGGAFGLWQTPRSKFSGYHGYWPVSNIQIDYRFGNPEILRKLIESAHAQNTNVLLDYVAHHVHQEHPVYVQNPGWATDLYLPDGSLNTERWDDYRLTTWFDVFLPTLDLSRKEIVDALVDSAVFWLTEYGIDGFRHDATKHIDELYWRTLTQRIRKLSAGKPFYQIGETYGSPLLINSYISTGMLDGQFDFNVYDNAVACFALDGENFDRLKTTLSESWRFYGYHNLMGYISGNQDRARFISYAGGAVSFSEDAKLAGWNRNITVGDSVSYNKLAMLHAFNFTIPGIPVIYYGDEIGMPGGNDPDNRRLMKFENLDPREETLKKTVQKLVGIRKSSMALLYGQSKILLANNTFLAYTRNYFNERVLVVFNKSRKEQKFEIELPADSKKLKPEFGSTVTTKNNKLAIGLKPLSFDIIYY